MTDHKFSELCESLRSAQLRGRLTVTCMHAADVIEQLAYDLAGRDALIEQQAARIAELESSGVMTAMLLTIDGRQYGVHPNVMARVKELDADNSTMARMYVELEALEKTMADLLIRTTNSLKGEPAPAGHVWGWQDLPELAKAAKDRIAELESKRGPITYDCASHGEWNARIVSGCPECIIEARKRIRELESLTVDNAPMQ